MEGVGDVLAVFRKTGAEAKEFRATGGIGAGIDVFCAAVESVDFEDLDLVCGMCWNLAPYICFNWKRMSENDVARMWGLVVDLARRVPGFPAAHGVVEGVRELVLHGGGVASQLIGFLGDAENVERAVYPYLLEEVEAEFFEANGRMMLRALSVWFGVDPEIDSVRYHAGLLKVLCKAKVPFEDLIGEGDLFSRMWRFVYEVASGDRFAEIADALCALNKVMREFFVYDEAMLDDAVRSCATFKDFVPLIRLMPSFGRNRFEVFFERLEGFISEHPAESCDFYDVACDAMDRAFSEDLLKEMAQRLMNKVAFEHDVPSVFLLSIYQDALAEYGKDTQSYIARAVSYGLHADTPMRVCLCSVIAYHAEMFLSFSKMVSTMVIPNLMKLLTDQYCCKFAAKAIKRLVSHHCVSPGCFLGELLDTDVLTKMPAENSGVFFSILAKIVGSSDDANTLNKIYLYCVRVVASEDAPFFFAAKAVDIISRLKEENEDAVESSVDICRDRCVQLLSCDDERTYVPAARYLAYAENVDIGPMLQRMTDIAMGRVASTPLTQRLVAQYIATICDEKKVPFPAEILHAYINHDDEDYKTCSVILMILLIENCPDFEALFTRALGFARVCKTITYLNEVLILAKKFIKLHQSKISQLDELLYGCLQARFFCFHHVCVFVPDSAFKFYNFVSAYIQAFPRDSVTAVEELIKWTTRVDPEILVQLLKPLNTGIRLMVYDDRSSVELWDRLNQCLADPKYDEPETRSAILSVAVSLRGSYPNLELESFLTHLATLWEMIDEDDDLRSILPQAYLDLYANEEHYPSIGIDPSLFQTIMTLMKEEQYEDWDYPVMLSNVSTILEKFGPFTDFWIMAADMASHFLTKHKDLDKDTEDTARKILTKCAENSTAVIPALKHNYHRYPKKWETLAEVFGIEP